VRPPTWMVHGNQSCSWYAHHEHNWLPSTYLDVPKGGAAPLPDRDVWQLRRLNLLDIRALREARSLDFIWDREASQYCELTCYGVEPDISPPLQGYSLLILNQVCRDGRSLGIPVGAQMHISGNDDHETMQCWRTIVAMCEPGDILKVMWQCDGATTREIHEAGFCGDILMIVILRYDEEIAFFRLFTHIGRRDGARMVHLEQSGWPI
jgi:hypothetical protein